MTKTRLCCLILIAIFLSQVLNAAAQLPALPSPNHPIMFGYYFADGRYGDFLDEVWDYTDTYVALPCGYESVPDNCGPHQLFADSLAKAAAANRKIFLVLNGESTWDWTLEYARPYWSSVKIVECVHEKDLTAGETETIVGRLKDLIASKGLAPKPASAMYGSDLALTTNSFFAPSLDVVGIETYMWPSDCVATPDCPNGASCVEKMNCRLEQAKARVPSNKKIIIVSMGFDRRTGGPPPADVGWAGDIPTLTALQDPPYLKAYNDPRVIGIFPFAYARHPAAGPYPSPQYPQGATRDYPTVKARHQEQGALLMRWMSIDAPASGVVTQPFNVGGWAVDQAARSGGGVDTIHVWATPTSGAPAIFLGAGTPAAGSRPDVGAYFGSPRFGDSGFNVTANGLPPGAYTISAYAHSTVTNTFTHLRTVTVTVNASPPAMNIDLPSNGGTVLQNFWVGGWAIDPAAASGPGVDTVHVWAIPSSGPSIFIGANYGIDRPDIGAAYGSSRFNPSGFQVLAHLSPGSYTVAAYAHSTVTNTFNQVKTVNITVQ